MIQKMQKFMTKKNKKGFTLIELIVVIAIIAILAAILIPRFSGFTDRAKQTQALVDAKQYATAMDSLKAESDTFTEAEIVSMAGIDSTVTAVSISAGSFTVQTSPGGFKAGRSGYGDPVVKQ